MEVNGGGAMAVVSEKLVYNESALKLSEIASVNMALQLWYSYVTQSEFEQYVVVPAAKHDLINYPNAGINATWFENLFVAVKNLGLPRCLEESIKKSLNRIHVEMTQYISILMRRIFVKNLRKYRIQNFNPKWWAWCGNGEIDRKNTALNMLWTSELTEVQKFVIMCGYRVIDDPKAICLCSLPTTFIEEMNFEENPRVFCWICYLNDQLHNIPLMENSTSINVTMAHCCLKDHFKYSWFEYFWDRLSIDDQITVAQSALIFHTCARFQKELLSKMNHNQQNRLLSKIPNVVVSNFWLDNDPECAIEMWTRNKDRFSVDQFGHLVHQIFAFRISSERDMSLLMQVWNTAGDHLKGNFIEADNLDVASVFFRYSLYSTKSPSSYKFLYQVLSTKSGEYKRKTMQKIVESLQFASYYSDSLVMADILKMCCPDEVELSKFKASVLNSTSTQSHAVRLVNELRFAELALMLMINSPNENTTKDFVKALLEDRKINKAKIMFCHSQWTSLCEFIDKVSNEGCFSIDMKKQFVSSFAATCWDHLNIDQKLDEMRKIVEPLLSSEELRIFKQILLNGFHEVVTLTPLYWYIFEEKYFRRFVSWCLDDDTKVEEFKSALPVGRIFDNFLLEACHFRGKFYRDSLDDLNKFLVWYFGCVEEAKKYKIRRMHEFDNDMVSEMVRENLQNVWEKLFDCDSEVFREFELEFMGHFSRKKCKMDLDE